LAREKSIQDIKDEIIRLRRFNRRQYNTSSKRGKLNQKKNKNMSNATCKTKQAYRTSGSVVAVRGSVVDIQFDHILPPIYSLLHANEGENCHPRS